MTTTRDNPLLAAFGLAGLGIERTAAEPAPPTGSVERWKAAREAAHHTIMIIGITPVRGTDGFGDSELRAPTADPRAHWLRLE